MFEKKILRASDVASILGISLPSLYRWVRSGIFPRGFRLGGHTVGWTSETVERWIEEKKAASVSE